MPANVRERRFQVASVLTAALYAYLFVSLLLAPASMLQDLGVEGSASLDFLARRVSALMLAFAALLFLARNASRSPVRAAISFSVGLNMAGFAVSSLSALLSGRADPSVWVVFVIEGVVAVAFFAFCASDALARRAGATARVDDREVEARRGAERAGP